MSNADELKSSGLKATLPRIKILEVFQNTTRTEPVVRVTAPQATGWDRGRLRVGAARPGPSIPPGHGR